MNCDRRANEDRQFITPQRGVQYLDGPPITKCRVWNNVQPAVAMCRCGSVRHDHFAGCPALLSDPAFDRLKRMGVQHIGWLEPAAPRDTDAKFHLIELRSGMCIRIDCD